MTCRHCKQRNANRARGLCWRCYYSPAQALYPTESKYGRLGIGNGYGGFTLPAAACDAPPGSPGKVSELAARAARMETLWHPEDADHDES